MQFSGFWTGIQNESAISVWAGMHTYWSYTLQARKSLPRSSRKWAKASIDSLKWNAELLFLFSLKRHLWRHKGELLKELYFLTFLRGSVSKADGDSYQESWFHTRWNEGRSLSNAGPANSLRHLAAKFAGRHTGSESSAARSSLANGSWRVTSPSLFPPPDGIDRGRWGPRTR